MKICSRCKLSYKDEYIFCKKCGGKLVFPQNFTKKNNLNNNNKSNEFYYVIFIVILLIVVGFGYYYFNNKVVGLEKNIKSQKSVVMDPYFDKDYQSSFKQNEKIENEQNLLNIINRDIERITINQKESVSDIYVNKFGYILDDDVIVKSEPNYDSINLGKVDKGNRLFIISYVGKWAKIKVNNNIGYILKSFISINGEDVDWSNGQKYGKEVHFAIVNATEVNMRFSNSKQSSVIGKFTQGEKVKVLGFYKEWVKVQRNNGQIGYIFRSYLSY